MLKRVGHYILERKIGAGSYGEVYQGLNEKDGQRVAVKVMERRLVTGKFSELFKNEVKILKSCQNENIIKIYDIQKSQNNIYMIYEFCNEGDMSDYLKTKGHLTEEEATKYFLEILNGFKTLVKNEVIHRDFKLSNLLKHNGSVKISDFGFSKLLGKWDMTETVVGSPINMAPEIIEGKSYNSKVDIWSLGIVFYQLLFGIPPYIGRNIFELLKEIKNTELKIPRDINNITEETEDILRKMLTPNPTKRIEWPDLFSHKVALKCQKESLLHKNFRQTLYMSSLLYWSSHMQDVNLFKLLDETRNEESFFYKLEQQREDSNREETISTDGSERVLSNSSRIKLNEF